MAQYKQPVGYGLSEALPNLSPFPVQAKRAPTTADKGYIPGTLWIYKTANAAYILTSVVNNLATWIEIDNAGGPGVFTTLTSSGNTTLATTGVTVNTFGTTNGATSVAISSGTAGTTMTSTGQILLTSSAALADAIQLTASNANGGVSFDSLLGGFDFSTTGSFTVATATGTIGISADATATTVNLATGAGVKTTTLGSTNTTSTTTVQSGSGALNITSTGGAQTHNSGTGALGISTDAAATAVSVGTGAAAKTVIVGSSTAGSSLALRSPATAGVIISNGTQAPGIFVGTGNPDTVVTAPQGSLFLNVGGSGTGDRLYVNTNGTTGWTNFVSAA